MLNQTKCKDIRHKWDCPEKQEYGNLTLYIHILSNCIYSSTGLQGKLPISSVPTGTQIRFNL